jgi:hypothetical protein
MVEEGTREGEIAGLIPHSREALDFHAKITTSCDFDGDRRAHDNGSLLEILKNILLFFLHFFWLNS